MSALFEKSCKACEGEAQALSVEQARAYLQELPGWQLDEDRMVLSKSFSFKNFYHVMAFVNAVAWMAHTENHHPDVQLSYNRCTVAYTTHAISGLSENDFICASKVEQLLSIKP